jgi:hypothetical protein
MSNKVETSFETSFVESITCCRIMCSECGVWIDQCYDESGVFVSEEPGDTTNSMLYCMQCFKNECAEGNIEPNYEIQHTVSLTQAGTWTDEDDHDKNQDWIFEKVEFFEKVSELNIE